MRKEKYRRRTEEEWQDLWDSTFSIEPRHPFPIGLEGLDKALAQHGLELVEIETACTDRAFRIEKQQLMS